MHLFQRKSFSQLLDISAKNFIFLRTFNGEFSYNEVWLNDQDSGPLEIEDKVKITLVIKYKNDSLFSLTKISNICNRLWILIFC